MKARSSKTYGHEIGLSCCWRQWRATSHCRFLHGYALGVHLEFEGQLDERGWVLDFGGLKPIKAWLETTFDHKLLVAEDDPALPVLRALDPAGLAQIVAVPGTGCEAFAALIYTRVASWLRETGASPRVRLVEVHVREHGANAGKLVA